MNTSILNIPDRISPEEDEIISRSESEYKYINSILHRKC